MSFSILRACPCSGKLKNILMAVDHTSSPEIQAAGVGVPSVHAEGVVSLSGDGFPPCSATVGRHRRQVEVVAPRNLYESKGKRLLDVLGATVGLIVCSPILMLSVMATWLDSGRPFLELTTSMGTERLTSSLEYQATTIS